MLRRGKQDSFRLSPRTTWAQSNGMHHHVHDEGPIHLSRAFRLALLLNIVYVVIQVSFGIWGRSIALVADAGHNLGDVLSLLLAWGAHYLSRRPATARRTYGWRRTSIMAALLNAVFLLIVVGAITGEALRRFGHQEKVNAPVVIVVALIGVVLNAITARLFMAGGKHDLNIRAAFLHMAADTAVSAGVAVAGVAILFSGWQWLDPLTSLLVNAVIIAGTWSLLRDSFNLAVDAAPAHVDVVAVRAYLSSRPRVTAVHDLHIWAMSTTQVALTAHLVMPNERGSDSFLHELCADLHDRFGIEHSTIQIEQNAEACSLA
jgi:cobalt-zinc-cadmium efflux system protein